MKALASVFGIFLLVVIAMVLNATLYVVDETEQVIVTRFQQVVGQPVRDPGLKVKMPFVDKVNRFSKMVMEWDGPSAAMPTREKVNIVVNTFARWQIKDPLVFFQKLRDERSAQSRLNDILGSETRKVVASHDFIEVVRSTKGRTVVVDPNLQSIDRRIGTLPPVQLGRPTLEKMIYESAKPKIAAFGIELLDVRIKRINYNPDVLRTIYDRMTSERMQIAERFRSEGQGEAAKKLGERDRDLKEIESEGYKRVQEIEGAADATATEIYAKAYNSSPDAASLFAFTKAMETLKKTITPDSTLVLTTDGDLMGYLKSADPSAQKDGDAVGAMNLLKGIPGLPPLGDSQ
jgi:modulator of FtsH protease HflC